MSDLDRDFIPETDYFGGGPVRRDGLVWFHRRVWVPGNGHSAGRHCFCHPVPYTQAEMRAVGFWDLIDPLHVVN